MTSDGESAWCFRMSRVHRQSTIGLSICNHNQLNAVDPLGLAISRGRFARDADRQLPQRGWHSHQCVALETYNASVTALASRCSGTRRTDRPDRGSLRRECGGFGVPRLLCQARRVTVALRHRILVVARYAPSMAYVDRSAIRLDTVASDAKATAFASKRSSAGRSVRRVPEQRRLRAAVTRRLVWSPEQRLMTVPSALR